MLGLSLGCIIRLGVGISSDIYYLTLTDDLNLIVRVTTQEFPDKLIVELVIAVDQARDIVVLSFLFLVRHSWLIVIRLCIRPKMKTT